MMNEDHLTQLCADYKLGTPVDIDTDHEGVLNLNYILTTSTGRFFVKSVRDKKRSSLPYIAEVEEFMQSSGIPAICMLSTPGGKKFVTYGSEVYTVYPFVNSLRTHEYESDDFSRMGEMLGHIHKAGSGTLPDSVRTKQFPERSIELVVEKLRGYQQHIEAKSVKDETDIVFLAYIHRKLEMMDRTALITPLPLETLTHGDYHARNLLMDGTRQIIGICDWEQASMNTRSYELARSLLYICFNGATDEDPNEYDNAIATDFARAFLAGYSSMYPITQVELLHGIQLRWKRLVRSFWIEEQYYTNGDARSCKFVPHEMRLMQDFADEKIVNQITLYESDMPS